MRRRFGIRDALYLTLICAVSLTVCRFFNEDSPKPFGRHTLLFYAQAVVVVTTLMTIAIAAFDQTLRGNWLRCPGRISLLASSVVILMVVATRLDSVWFLEYKMHPQPNPIMAAFDHLIYDTVLNPTQFAPAYAIVVSWIILWMRRDTLWSFDWPGVVGILTGLFWAVFGFARHVLGW